MDKIVQADISAYPALATAMQNKVKFNPPADLYDEEIDVEFDEIEIEDEIEEKIPNSLSPSSPVFDELEDETAEEATEDVESEDEEEHLSDKDELQPGTTTTTTTKTEQTSYTLLYVAIAAGFGVLLAIFGLLIALVIRKRRNAL